MDHLGFHCNPDAEELAHRLAKDVAQRLERAIDERSFAILVVSGGSTPKPFFRYLSQLKISWEKVLVTLADERCVDPTNDASNAKLVSENLLQNAASTAQFIPLFGGDDTGSIAAKNISTRLTGLSTYDVVILGMGDDGHTASIFPKASNRAQALDTKQTESALLVDPVTVKPLRITQTARRLLDSHFLAVHITGKAKALVLKRIIANPDPEQWPISRFIEQAQVPAKIYSDIEIDR